MKTISARTLKRGNPEDRLLPGESLLVKKNGGRVFELKRVDVRKKSMIASMKEVMREIPNPCAKGKKTDVVRWCEEDGL
jgi:hypothetical protein